MLGAWQLALATQAFLGGAEDYFASVVINGRALKQAVRQPERIHIGRGPLPVPAAPDEYFLDHFQHDAVENIASVRRDVLRAAGLPAYEDVLPPDEDGIWHLRADPHGDQREWAPWPVRNQLSAGREHGRRR